MDLDYIRLLMLYSDVKFPFEKAKSDPGLTESVRKVRGFLSKHGDTRKLSNEEASETLLNERIAKKRTNINSQYIPKSNNERDNE